MEHLHLLVLGISPTLLDELSWTTWDEEYLLEELPSVTFLSFLCDCLPLLPPQDESCKNPFSHSFPISMYKSIMQCFILTIYRCIWMNISTSVACTSYQVKLTCCAEDPGILSTRSVATSLESSHLSALLPLWWSDDLLLESCLLETRETDAYWGWGIGCSTGGFIGVGYETKVGQGLGTVAGFGVW